MQASMENLERVFPKKEQNSAHWTMTMTRGGIIVHHDLKVHGGTAPAITQIWTVCISRGSMKVLETVSIGITGRATTIH